MDLVLDVVINHRDGGPEQIQDQLQPLRLEQMWGLVLDELLVAERRLFATGRGWKDDKASTIQRKARDKDPRVRANSGRTNVASGAMEQFMTTRSAHAQPLKLDADELRIGIPSGQSDVFYARFQAAQGRDPRVSRAVVRRVANEQVRAHLFGA